MCQLRNFNALRRWDNDKAHRQLVKNVARAKSQVDRADSSLKRDDKVDPRSLANAQETLAHKKFLKFGVTDLRESEQVE